MRAQGMDALVLMPGTNFAYLTGRRFARERHRLLAAVITSGGDLALMGPSFEERAMGSGPVPAAIHTWTDEEDQYRRLAALVTASCGARPCVGLEPTTNHYHALALREALPEASLVDATKSTDGLRAIKSEAEIACLREAAGRTRARMLKVPSQLVAGMSMQDLGRLYGPSAMIQIGLTTSLPNETSGSNRLSPGDAVVIDAGDRIEGYRSDLTRTFFFGEPSPRMREVYGIVREAEAAAIEAVRPGAPAEDVDLAARRVIERAGYGAFFTHRGGHGIGLDFHEAPICVRGNKEPLVPGMVLTAEPGIYLPGEFGVRLEDDILVTESGHAMLSEPGPFEID